MKKTLFTIALFTVFLAASGVNAQTKGWMSRYWDGCKPSCSWSGKQYANGVGRCKECDENNNLMATNDQNRSSCDGGNSYTCWDMIPFVSPNDPNTAYAFAATPSDQCGMCFELTFDGGFQHGNAGATHQALKGKKLIVMGSNMGGDVGAGQFDVLIPGGGVGIFDSFSSQIGVSGSTLGERHGGLLAACGNPTNLATAQSCLKTKCADAFGKAGQEWLKAGCEFYADWFMAANNPTMTYRTVTCPQALVDRYQKAATGKPDGGGGTNPTNYTLTVNTATGGTVTPSGAQSVASGAATTITATPSNGYRFVNWTVVSGTATITNANQTPTTVIITGNATVRANFAQTLTLTVTRDPAAGGTTTPASSQTNIAAGIATAITAAPANGYRFVNWTLTTGTATFANANSAATTVTLTSNATIRANFETISVNPTTYTLTVNANPSTNGTVNPSGARTVNSGAATTITATPSNGYKFVNWTVTSGTAAFANANSAATTVTLTSNATIQANFAQDSGPTDPDDGSFLEFAINIIPPGSGRVDITPNKTLFLQSEPISLRAVPNPGFAFDRWDGDDLTGSNPQASTTVWWHRSVFVYFKTGSGGGNNNCDNNQGGNINANDAIKVEAENYTSNDGNGMRTSDIPGGGSAIGYIENGFSATYNTVNAPQSGTYTMQFRVANGMIGDSSKFSVSVNGTAAGTVTVCNTADWDTYEMATLKTDVQLNEGNNRVVLNFQSAINVDYFLLILNDGQSVKLGGAKANARTRVTLRPAASGFSAMLPNNHEFQSYSLIDLQGREIRKGKIQSGAAELHFSNMRQGVMFLRLKGKNNSTTVLRANTF